MSSAESSESSESSEPSAESAHAARIDPPLIGHERAVLIGFLDYHRETLAWKCAGLSAEQLATRSVPPSSLSLLGLVRHLAEVERSWFREFAGETFQPLYYTPDEPDLDFDGAVADDAVVTRAFADWRTEIEHGREIVGGADLEDTFLQVRHNETISLRWVLAHLVEEYARHNGHADLLREAIDGRTGE